MIVLPITARVDTGIRRSDLTREGQRVLKSYTRTMALDCQDPDLQLAYLAVLQGPLYPNAFALAN